jgi:chromate transport protein ChrA
VSYVTEYDLASFEKVQKTSFVIGTLMLVLAGALVSLTLSHVFSQHGISSGNIFLFLLSSLPMLIGASILYRLAKQSLQKWEDLGRAIIDGITIWRKFKIS